MTANPLPVPRAASRPLRTARALTQTLSGVMAGGRLTADSSFGLSYTPALILSPPDAEGQWRAIDLDLASLDRIPPAKIMQPLADLSPTFSGALWQFMRFLNPGWSYRIVDQDKQEVVAPAARAAVQEALAAIGAQHGTFGVAVNALNMNALLRGAYLGEAILDAAGRQLIGLAVPDAASARFRRERDPELGTVDKLGQMQGGQFVPLDRPTIRYIPIDRFPDSPYGRPPLAAAIFTSLFQIGFLRDLRRVVAQQGWPRHDIEVNTQKLYDDMVRLAEVQSEKVDIDDFFDRVDRLLASVATAYAGLPPDAAWVHTTDSKINRPTGAVDASSLGAVDGLMGAIDRASVQALKTQGFLLNLSESATETQAIRQMEAFHADRARLPARRRGRALRLADARPPGARHPRTVEFRFAENRASEEIRDLQAEQLNVAIATSQYEAGWISQDEAAKRGAGKDKADQAEPRVLKGGASAATVDPNASLDGQPNRALLDIGRRAVALHRRASTPFTPSGADADLPELPESVDLTDDDLRGVLGVWDDEAFKGQRYAGLLDAEVVD